MGVSLSKGGNVSLSKNDANLKKVCIGLGWDVRMTDGADFDLDGSVFLLTDSGKVRNDSDFIFYNNLTSTDGSVVHTGDNRTGDSDGDDESIIVDLSAIPSQINKLVFTVTIHDADVRRQNFGQVRNAYMRIVNESSNVEMARFDLTEDASTETAMIFGELYRHNGEWKFKAVGQGFAGGLAAMCAQFGIHVS